jgi:type I restriction enzyme S subunit
MANDWHKAKVGDIARSVSETHPKDKANLIFLNTSDVFMGKILHSTYSGVSEWPGQAKKSIRCDDILFSEIRPANGRYAYVDIDAEDYVVSTKLMVIRTQSDRVVPKFLYHFLTSRTTTAWLQHLAESRSGTFPQITFDQVAELEISLPPVGDQDAIANFVDLIDEMIALNQQGANETLEDLARAIFKSWFVDFDPVRAKAEGRDPALPKSLAGLFPKSFQESKAGEIPKGWTVLGLDETARFLNGLALQKFPPKDGRFLPVIKIAQLHTEDTAGADKASADLAPEYVVEDGDVLFSWSGSLECILWAGGRGALNQHLFKVTSELYPKWFYFLWIRHHLAEFRGIAAGKATTMGHIQRHHLSAAKVVAPPEPLLKEMSRHFAPLIEHVVHLKIASKTLAAIRDALLPKLMSGDIRIPDAQRIFGEQV